MSQRVEVVSNLRVRKNLPEGSTHGLPTLTFVRTFRSFTTTAGRECGSEGKAPDLLRVVAWLLAPGFHLPHAARPPFHTEGRNPTGLLPDPSSRVRPWPARHTCGPVPTALPRHSSCTAATR